jgi:hypothetical protein
METQKCLGIWMDHANAYLINWNTNKTSTIQSNFTFEIQEEAIHRSEKLMHNKEQQMDEAYYKELSENILKFDHVLLFGPTNAKLELSNFLKKDLHFKDIKIDIEAADKMSDNEKLAFVKAHFN